MRNERIATRERLLHILEAIEEIWIFTAGMSKAGFLANKMACRAVLYQFIVIGEAVAQVDPAMLEKYAYPWYKVRAFRNFIAHEYFGIKYESVWEIIDEELPALKKMVEKILEKEFQK